jgi:hypothetical protein
MLTALRARTRNRTGDLTLTMRILCRLSYPGWSPLEPWPCVSTLGGAVQVMAAVDALGLASAQFLQHSTHISVPDMRGVVERRNVPPVLQSGWE